MSCFHMSAQLRVCLSHALSRLRALFHVGAWFSNPGTHVLSFDFVPGVRILVLHVLVVWACSLKFAQPRTLLSTCIVFCVARGLCSVTCTFSRMQKHLVFLHAVCVFIGCMHSCYVLCFSLAACFHVVVSCMNTWLMSILICC